MLIAYYALQLVAELFHSRPMPLTVADNAIGLEYLETKNNSFGASNTSFSDTDTCLKDAISLAESHFDNAFGEKVKNGELHFRIFREIWKSYHFGTECLEQDGK